MFINGHGGICADNVFIAAKERGKTNVRELEMDFDWVGIGIITGVRAGGYTQLQYFYRL